MVNTNILNEDDSTVHSKTSATLPQTTRTIPSIRQRETEGHPKYWCFTTTEFQLHYVIRNMGIALGNLKEQGKLLFFLSPAAVNMDV